jgi:hypothetical protein
LIKKSQIQIKNLFMNFKFCLNDQSDENKIKMEMLLTGDESPYAHSAQLTSWLQ